MPQNEYGLSAVGWWAAKEQLATALTGLVAFQNQVANPGCEVDTSNITATGPTLTRDTTQSVRGTASLRATGSGAIADLVEWFSTAGARMTVLPGHSCAWSVQAKVTATTPTIRMGIKWYTSGAALISESTGANNTITAAEDWEYLTLTATAPATAAFAVPNVKEVAPGTWPSGTNIYFDAAMFNVGPLIPSFDGDIPGGSWTGTQGASVSNAAIKTVFRNPPNGIKSDEWPCFIIYPPAIEEIQRRPGGWRVKFYRVQVTCLVSDAEVARANAWADAFREGFVDAIDNNLRMNETVDIASGPTTEIPPDAIVYDNRAFIGFDGFVTFRISDAITYGD